ncbi:hypothetical protein [Streptosporangium jomthongense]|uniref:Uncharacterized protein n=1 Tax=Streptosporangium jomthongense TaxID=1193683 RepID=A0ABV8F234_9ACTN
MKGYSVREQMKNGPALAGRGTEAVSDTIAKVITGLPGQLRRLLS